MVIPTHNRAQILGLALDSVHGQTHRPIELIVIDDGSTDDTTTMIEAWEKERAEPGEFYLRYIRQENQGANAARNRGISEATGTFVAFLDSDDQWFPAKLSKQLRVFENDPDVGGVYCGLRYRDLDTGVLADDRPREYPQGDLLRTLLIHDVTEGEPCWVVRRSCFENVGVFDESLSARLGWDLWIRLAAEYRIGCVPEVLVYGGTHTGERVRSNPQRELNGHQQIFDKYAYLRKRFAPGVSLAARAAMYRRRGRVYFHRDISWPKAMGYQLAAILCWPINFDSYAALLGMLIPKGIRQRIHLRWNRIFGSTRLAIRSH